MQPKSRERLRASWESAWRNIGVARAPSYLDEVLRRYSEPHRAYHGLQHLEECLAQLAQAEHLVERPGEVQVSLW